MGTHSAASARPAAWRIALQVLGVALPLAFAASLLIALVRAQAYRGVAGVLLPLWFAALPLAAAVSTVAVAAWLAIFHALGPWLATERKRSWAATAAAGVLPAAGLAMLVNSELLPGFWQASSIIGNVALLAGLVAFGLLLSVALSAWQRRALATDPPASSTAALIVALAGGLLLFQSLRTPSGPHVFVFLIDVLGASHLGCYGYERATSPNIDRFAKDAVLFEQPVSSGTFTKTSVASIFTGLAPHHHGVYVGNLKDSADQITSDVLSRDLTVMAEEMKQSGFVTLGFVHNGQLRPYMGFDQGFDLYNDDPGWMPKMVKLFRLERRHWARSQRLFTYMHFLDLHGPYVPVAPYKTMFGKYSDTFDSIDDHGAWTKYVASVRFGNVRPTKADAEQLRSLHDGQLVYIDKWFGRMLEDLKEEGLYEESLIILMGDHGDAFLQHGFIDHSNLPYQELLRVPLIIKLPGGRNAGSRVKTPVGTVDLLPTLLALDGAKGTGRRDGKSFLGLLNDPSSEAAPGIQISEFEKSAAIREGNWKLLFNPKGPLELYDLERDPGELTNRHGEAPEVARRLEERLAAVLEARAKVSERPRVVVDPKTVKELEALGYLAAGDESPKEAEHP